MKIHVYKSKTLQIKDFEPVRFEYGLEHEIKETGEESIDEIKEFMEERVDRWIEEETDKLLKAKKLKANHGAVHPSLDEPPF